jgi:hypothetical protein
MFGSVDLRLIDSMNRTTLANMAINPAPCGRWTLRHKAAQRRLFLR